MFKYLKTCRVDIHANLGFFFILLTFLDNMNRMVWKILICMKYKFLELPTAISREMFFVIQLQRQTNKILL